MTDIRLPLGGVKFSVRAVILCTRGDTLLTNCGPGEHGSGFHFLPGGAVRADEDAAQAAARGRFTLEGVENHAPRTSLLSTGLLFSDRR